jgi:hypothetical protein
VETATLPQYQASPAIMERFVDAALAGGIDLKRSPNARGIKIVEQFELQADRYDYFFDRKPELEAEFVSDLEEQIGREKAGWFCDVVARDWYDGRGLRNGARVVDLKTSVREYLRAIAPKHRRIATVVQKAELENEQSTLSVDDVSKILQTNHQMMVRHIEAWKAIHPNADSITNDDIFLRRGLSLKEPLPSNVTYVEWDYINSYSLAFSASEKFAQMAEGAIPALVNGEMDLFEQQILFFSPWIPNMAVGQLEAGIIPQWRRLVLTAQGEHGGIYEYLLEP